MATLLLSTRLYIPPPRSNLIAAPAGFGKTTSAAMQGSNGPAIVVKGPTPYEIVIEDHLMSQRLRQFGGLRVTHRASGETVITGQVCDQSALSGLLNWLHHLGGVLVLVRRLYDDRVSVRIWQVESHWSVS
jgi:hypothetical protein